MGECLFCKIAAGEIPAEHVYEDQEFVAFEDINPQAPTHCLVIPRRHIATLNEVGPAERGLLGGMVEVGAKVAKRLGHEEDGYRLVLNCNADAGQTVFHIHLHVLAGRPMGWPPG
ncbi:MAG: histidine triad nucleotide-binding protein [Nitrospirae bacterium]|nr:MAG: histidine triad nucleotide-binding protein [Nitrospirota bacterium]